MSNISESNIFNSIIEIMITAQKLQLDDKKQYVMNMIKNNLSYESYERYEPFISVTIDALKYISRNKNVLKQLQKNNCKCII